MGSEPLKPEDARAALNSVATAERAGMRAAVPTRGYAVAAALLVAALFASRGLEDPGFLTALLLFVALGVMLAARRRMPAWRRKNFRVWDRRTVVAGVLCAAAIMTAYTGSLFAAARYGVSWAPGAVGVILGVLIIGMNEYARAATRRPGRERERG